MKGLLFFWFCVNLTPCIFSQMSWTNFTPNNSGLRAPVVRALEVDYLNRIWVGYAEDKLGVSIYNGQLWTSVDTSNGLCDNRVNVIFQDSKKNIWCGTQNGLCKFEGTSWTTFNTRDGLPNNFIISVFEDKTHNLWVGTVNGLSQYNGLTWQNYNTNDGLANNYIYSIQQDKMGNMWFAYGLNPSGVTRFDGLNWKTFKKSDGLMSNQVNTILPDHLGKIWFGCYGLDGGISSFVDNTWTSYALDSLTSCHNVWASLENQNDLWFGTSCNGGTVLNRSSVWSIYKTNNSGIGSNNILKIVADSLGNVWFGGYDGLSKLSKTPTSVDEKNLDNSFVKITQNTEGVHFNLENTEGGAQLTLFTIDGKIVFKTPISAAEYFLDTTKFAKGIYVIFITSNNKTYTQKITLF